MCTAPFPGHGPACHERLDPHCVRARRGRRAVALRLVGAVTAALKLVDLTVSYDRRPLGAGARLVHLGVGDHMSPLRRQRLGAEDAHPAPDPLDRSHRPVRHRRRATSAAILDTEISPELVPARHDGDDPAEHAGQGRPLRAAGLQPLLHHPLRPQAEQGRLPGLACLARRDARQLAAHSAETRHEYDLATIKQWLEVFLFRFFEISQFKRSAMPNGPKVGSGGALSPRGDWRAPSDSEADVWLEELRRNVP